MNSEPLDHFVPIARNWFGNEALPGVRLLEAFNSFEYAWKSLIDACPVVSVNFDQELREALASLYKEPHRIKWKALRLLDAVKGSAHTTHHWFFSDTGGGKSATLRLAEALSSPKTKHEETPSVSRLLSEWRESQDASVRQYLSQELLNKILGPRVESLEPAVLGLGPRARKSPASIEIGPAYRGWRRFSEALNGLVDALKVHRAAMQAGKAYRRLLSSVGTSPLLRFRNVNLRRFRTLWQGSIGESFYQKLTSNLLALGLRPVIGMRGMRIRCQSLTEDSSLTENAKYEQRKTTIPSGHTRRII